MKRKMKLPKIKINTQLAEQFNEGKIMQDLQETRSELSEASDKQSTYDTDKGKSFSFNTNTLSGLKDEILTKDGNTDLVKILDNVYIANEPTAENSELLEKNQISHAINLVSNEESKRGEKLVYYNACLRDTPDFDILQTGRDVTKFIDSNEQEDPSAQFLIYGKKGISRSVAVCAGYMILKHKMSLDDSLSTLRSKKPKIDPNIGFLGQLKTLEESVQSGPLSNVGETFNFEELGNTLK